MLLFPGGQERTAREYAGLPEKAAFRLQRIVPTTSVRNTLINWLHNIESLRSGD
jgi:hypothetical protein